MRDHGEEGAQEDNPRKLYLKFWAFVSLNLHGSDMNSVGLVTYVPKMLLDGIHTGKT
jgi:hypothetical protein